MAKFKNNHNHDVYVDLGGLVQVKPGQVLDLEGAASLPPLTRLMDIEPVPRPTPKKKSRKKSKSSATSGTI